MAEVRPDSSPLLDRAEPITASNEMSEAAYRCMFALELAADLTRTVEDATIDIDAWVEESEGANTRVRFEMVRYASYLRTIVPELRRRSERFREAYREAGYNMTALQDVEQDIPDSAEAMTVASASTTGP